MTDGVMFDIKRYAIHDGPGIRITFFLTGCPLSCWWCHNPEGLRVVNPQEVAGLRQEQEGFRITVMTVEQALEQIEKERIFIDESGGGVTFSGGEPLSQPEFLNEVLAACRERELHTAVDTSGHASMATFETIRDKVDLFLYDLKLMDDARHQEYTGVGNGLILQNLSMLAQWGCPTVIRFPVVPGINDDDENVTAMADFVAGLEGIDKFHLLPYHGAAEGKYERLDLENKMTCAKPPAERKLEVIKASLEQRDFVVEIGG
ncbi:glycyl-radical enzyme activating protein [Candidatus Sumerlaeota bacterium]